MQPVAEHEEAVARSPELARRSPDPHGQAALLLVESLIHGLIDRRMLTSFDAIQIIEVAAEIKVEVAEEIEENSSVMAASLALLHAMSSSLQHDLPA